MSVSCKYRDMTGGPIETLTCQFGCCEHYCCTEEEQAKLKMGKLSSSELGMLIGIPVASFILLLIVIRIIIYYRRKRQIMQREALLQQYFARCVIDAVVEASRPRPTLIIHVESEVGQSQSPGGEIELPVTQGPPPYEETTKPPPSFEEATGLSPESGILGRGHSGYRRFENEYCTSDTNA